MITRRGVVAGATAGVSFTFGSGIFAVARASPVSGPAGRLIQRTYAEHCAQVDYVPMIRTYHRMASSYDRVSRDLESSGFATRETHGFCSYETGSNRLIALDAGDSLGVASEDDAGCICTVLPEETGALLSCLDGDMGLPAVYQRHNRAWNSAAALRYATPSSAMWRRERCSRVSSRFKAFGEGEDRCEIEITPHMDANGAPTGKARVRIESPTGQVLEHPALPTHPSTIPSTPPEKHALAGDWRIIG